MTRTSYHHGALREALLAACLRLIETEGIAAVSLRRVAREAGVSSGAPYHHFADRAALLADLATEGFRKLGSDVAAARDAAPTPLAGLTAIADAYVRFARDNPGYFRLMFRPELSQPDKHPETRAAGEAAFAVLADAVAECVGAGELPADKADTLAVTLWGLAHGLASLWLDGQLEKRSALMGTTAPELVADIMRNVNALIAPGS
ncbi:TetR/AcrR family transcriptional regulator [Nocardia cyriacigeorgica]|uniref:TetR/AcrR family transcriptional regulator n=1 Tax=Nocardia cyriacigeorgica TaxID=135487 RepID=UPI0013D1014C|nr:TetR/AcrR family transcriptional regulator [Nocardia cyriacigeorgica]MBF6435509.1 TetR/AcrR family transcriptional regulator [Nocardia cyriacigeorgica]NEW25956.1 TetR/AcrR family transcriptional regulator [Nocardia cyriacigeorgica]